MEPGRVAEGDGHMPEAVMRNRLGNAWKYTANTLKAKIRVYVEGKRQAPLFCIQDNGAGFDMAHAEKLFQPFQRCTGRRRSSASAWRRDSRTGDSGSGGDILLWFPSVDQHTTTEQGDSHA